MLKTLIFKDKNDKQVVPSLLMFHHKVILSILKHGPVPHHIAFIMDGNRRYAQKKGIQKLQGHSRGVDTLQSCLEWCHYLGVKEVTLFAFSLDNLLREKTEVDYLMQLAKDKLLEMSQNNQILQRLNVRVSICGDLTKCPEDVVEAMEKVMQDTQNNYDLKLNIAFCYSSTYELERTINIIQEQVEQNILKIDDVTEETIWNNLLIKTKPDIIVRTSNEIRLSDFLIFQGVSSILEFIEEKWPEMGIVSMCKIILRYQMYSNGKKQNLDKIRIV